MPYEFYKLLHYFGILLTFVALGGVTLHALNGGDKASNRSRALVAASHGIGMVLILVAGFGLLARIGQGFGAWVFIKLAIWLAVGGLLVLPTRAPKLARVSWFLIPLLGVAAAAVAIYKPGVAPA